MTAPSPARAAGRRRRVLLAAAIAVALTVAPTAAGATTTPTPNPTGPTGTVTFLLAPVAGGVAQPGEGVAAIVAVQNDTLDTLPAAPVRLLLGDAAFTTRQEAAAWRTAPDARAVQEAGSITLDAVAPGERRTWSFAIAATDPLLTARAPGVYPLLAVYGEGTASRSAASTLVVAQPATTATPVAVVVPITAPPQIEGIIPSDRLAEYTAVNGALTQQLDGVEGTAAILAVDPAVVASIRILGTSAPDTATAWLTRLRALPNSRFALQFGDADVSAQLHSDLGMLLEPEPFDAQLDPADFATEQPDGASPTPGAVREPSLPAPDELLDIGGPTTESVYWPATGTADASTLDALDAVDEAALALVPSDTTAAGASGAAAPARGEDALVYDSAVSAALTEASGIDDQVARAAALADVAAQLAFAVPQVAAAPLLVAVDRGDGRSRVALRAAITAVEGSDGVAVDDLGDLLAVTPVEVQVTGGAPDADRAAAVDALVADESAVAALATVLDDPRLLTAPQRASTLQVLGDGWLTADAVWRAALAEQHAVTLTTLGSVSLLPPTDVNLLTANTRLQFVVRNALPWPVSVRLVAEPDDLRLRVQPVTEVAAGSTSDTRVVVPVESLVGNGDVTIDLQLRSPTGVAIGAADSVDVRVRAEWEGIGVVVLSVVVGGLLVLGVVRTVLRRRGRRSGDVATASDVGGVDA